MDSHNKITVLNKVSFLTTDLEKEQELYLLKYALLIKNDLAQALGPLDQPPQKTPQVPYFVVRERIADSEDCYVLSRGDQQGELKIDKFGNLVGNRHFLFPTFSLHNRPNQVYVLARDLLKCLDITGMSADHFLAQNPQLFGVSASDEEITALKNMDLINDTETAESHIYVTTKSVFMLFGARVVLAGTRLIDDYWEELVKEQGYLPHSRVFPISNRILQIVEKLKPTSHVEDAENEKAAAQISSEPSYLTVAEQTSSEIRQDYAHQLMDGERQDIIIPGQNIVGSIELSAQSKLPKYHSKTSLQTATQMGIQDTSIGLMPPAPTNAPSAPPSEKLNKEHSGGILDALVISKIDKSGVTQWANSGIVAQDVSLNINGWKFDSLPVKSTKDADLKYSIKGLPLYDNVKLAERLKRLTPNEINEMQHLHDAVYLNTNLQGARKIRKTKWTKYWQYKAGLPIGLTDRQCGPILDKYFEKAAEHIEVVRSINTTLNKEEVRSMRKIPNANYKGYSNITGVKPPYVNE
ncbi:LAME_0A07954g1_1 [Lachancea meyersii CBS 8951]|uniref:LAME_0A07954g1_1 n=1 Tax=Lachancea meyersii CBS 8951 TaxID=1266667 RepID=A0A1G4IR67_9SACH|nr:LAME_0A07954g1_1 [Lachancea meyersii CBS 8951]